MQRSIIFRARPKSGDVGSWVYGWLQEVDGDTCYIRNGLAVEECWTATAGQFTGLFGSDKKRIYEGDIVRITTENETWKELVYFAHGAFIIGAGNPDGFVDLCGQTEDCWKDVRVVGCIHDGDAWR
ncbi:MAG: YopX family protein [Christensenellaceae bacterium]|jgi:hypothetical protein|nr:YopX family protein [Christensenellaceae bacterium]